MRLIDLVHETQATQGRRLVFPVGIFPAVAWTGTDFIQNCTNAETQTKTLQCAVEKLGMDLVRTVVDLVSEAEAMGCPVSLNTEEPPSVESSLDRNTLPSDQVPTPDPYQDGRLPMQLEIMRRSRDYLDSLSEKRYLLGSCVGPFTLLGHVFGTSEATVGTVLDPETMHAWLRPITKFLTSYAQALMDNGADILWVSEPLASVLSPEQYWEFSGKYCQEIFDQVEGMAVLHICGDSTMLIDSMVATGVDALSLDERVNLSDVMSRIPADTVVIGNLSPLFVLENSPEEIAIATRAMLDEMMAYPNYVPSTGCALPAKTPLANALAFMDTCKQYPALPRELTDLLIAIRQSVIDGASPRTKELVANGLQKGLLPLQILNGALIPAINYLGMQYQKNAVFIPELLMAAEAVYAGLDKIRPLLVAENNKPKGTVLIGTVQNDLHDIGKNLVAMMLESNFYEVINAGKNVSAAQFIELALKHKPDVIALSALTTSTMTVMADTISALRAHPELANIKIIVGGAPVTNSYAEKIGADSYAPDAAASVVAVGRLLER
jgi:MtaA/CmuA family methyltransferase